MLGVVQRREDPALLGRRELLVVREDLDHGPEECKAGQFLVRLGRLSQLGQREECEEECGDDVHGEDCFVVFGQREGARVHACVQHDRVEAREVRGDALAEALDGGVAR